MPFFNETNATISLEFKNYNDKLIKYFDHEKLKVLIDYITVMPTQDDGQSRGHKYPFIAGEIFNCEINQILDKFFEVPEKNKADLLDDDAEKKSDGSNDSEDDNILKTDKIAATKEEKKFYKECG